MTIMSAVEVITAALVAGASVGVKETASAVVKDAYADLKALLRHRMGNHGDHILQEFEVGGAGPGVWRTRIGGVLVESGAVDDARILDAARRLLALADPDNAQALHIDVDTNYGAVGEFHAPVTFHQGPPVPPTRPAVQ